MMNISHEATIFTPDKVRQSLQKSGWNLHSTRRSFSTGGSYEVWQTGNDKWHMGYATIPVSEEYTPQFAQETLASVAKYYQLSQDYVYQKLFHGEAI